MACYAPKTQSLRGKRDELQEQERRKTEQHFLMKERSHRRNEAIQQKSAGAGNERRARLASERREKIARGEREREAFVQHTFENQAHTARMKRDNQARALARETDLRRHQAASAGAERARHVQASMDRAQTWKVGILHARHLCSVSVSTGAQSF
jgi:hypothetical protein